MLLCRIVRANVGGKVCQCRHAAGNDVGNKPTQLDDAVLHVGCTRFVRRMMKIPDGGSIHSEVPVKPV